MSTPVPLPRAERAPLSESTPVKLGLAGGVAVALFYGGQWLGTLQSDVATATKANESQDVRIVKLEDGASDVQVELATLRTQSANILELVKRIDEATSKKGGK